MTSRGSRYMLAFAVGLGLLLPATCNRTMVPDGRADDGMARVGPVFTLEFRDADVKDVLRAIGQENDINIIVSEDVSGRVTLSFQRVSLWQALDAITRSNNLLYFRDGSVIRVVKSPFGEGEQDLKTELVSINFSGAKESSESVRPLLSRKGTLSVDARTNTIIIRDTPDNVERIAAILKQLDSPTRQIVIEARIVEAATTYSRDLGIQWGGSYTGTSSTGSSTIGGGLPTASSLTPTNNLAVNFPANTKGGGGALGFTFSNISNTFDLDLALSALEDSGKGRILSSPRVMTLDNKEAKISSGTEILIPVTTITTGIQAGAGGGSSGSSTSGVTTINAKLELIVTPHVTPDGRIALKVQADKKEADFSRTVQDIPPLNTRSAETNLLVRNGETVVIGGIFTKNETHQEQGIPWLSKIPVLGWLFKKDLKVESQNELLIFITPRIHEPEPT